MDTFDLGWPQGTATLCTDGWRCRIVWRGTRGIGGSIENNELCMQRVADGMSRTPRLLEQLRARGHLKLATNIEHLAVKVEAPAARPDAIARQPEKAQAEPHNWLEDLEASSDWETCGLRRAKVWHEVMAGVFIKMPAAKGKPEWILKWAKRDKGFDYVCAPAFKGLCIHVQHRGMSLDDFVSGCQPLAADSADIAHALDAWSASQTRH